MHSLKGNLKFFDLCQYHQEINHFCTTTISEREKEKEKTKKNKNFIDKIFPIKKFTENIYFPDEQDECQNYESFVNLIKFEAYLYSKFACKYLNYLQLISVRQPFNNVIKILFKYIIVFLSDFEFTC